MSIITVILVLAIVGLAAWAVTTYIPMDIGFKRLIVAVAIIASVLWLLSAFGLLSGVNLGPGFERKN